MKYQFSATVTVSISTEVEAATPEQALEIAQSRSMQGICHQCASGELSKYWVLSGELDGEAANIKID